MQTGAVHSEMASPKCGSSEIKIRIATPNDALHISLLYHEVYNGTYSDPLMREIRMLSAFLKEPTHVWVVAEDAGDIIGSVVYESIEEHGLAKVFGGAVKTQYRGAGVLERCMVYGQECLEERFGIEVIYATTRTSTPAPQIVTEKLGYHKLGLFPNVHRTDVYETHGLVGRFSPSALERRRKNYKIHPLLKPLWDIVRDECGFEDQELARDDECSAQRQETYRDIELELIQAPKFVKALFEERIKDGALQSHFYHFYPFHEPNVLVTTPCRRVEMFLSIASSDKYSTIIGFKKPVDFDFSKIQNEITRLLCDLGVRYIETIVRADNLKMLTNVLNAKFIPCAFFPAFQRVGDERHDYVVFSRTFEVIDFSALKLTGRNGAYLEAFAKIFQEWFLKPQLLLDKKRTPRLQKSTTPTKSQSGAAEA